MASLHVVSCKVGVISNVIIIQDKNYEDTKATSHFAALNIQRIWRGYDARQYVKKMHFQATVIEKNIRQYLVHANMSNHIIKIIEYKAMKYFNRKASIIQAHWKGYKFRKDHYDFRQVYANKKKVNKMNAELRKRMNAIYYQELQYTKQQAEIEAKYLVFFILFKLHHLLRTYHREGIYSSHNSDQYSAIETLMKSITFHDYMKALRDLYVNSYITKPPQKYLFPGHWKNCEEANYKRDRDTIPKKPPPVDPKKFIQKKAFICNRCVKPQRAGYLIEEYQEPIRHIVRKFDKKKDISKKHFTTSTKITKIPPKYPPYYIDFWHTICEIHNIVDDVRNQ